MAKARTSKSGSKTKPALQARRDPLLVLVATRKGAWLYHGDGKRKTWRVDGPHFLGHIINHLVLDPRDGRTLLTAAKTGHLGPTVFRSTDLGRTWNEAARPPAFAKASDGSGRAVDHTFWLTPCHTNEPNVWYAGTSPQGLFRSEDGGDTWQPFSSINEDPQYRIWMGTVQDGTPDGPKLHSIIVDPRDPAHLYVAMSGGGVHESVDGGRTFTPILKGLEVVEGFDAARRNQRADGRLLAADSRLQDRSHRVRQALPESDDRGFRYRDPSGLRGQGFRRSLYAGTARLGSGDSRARWGQAWLRTRSAACSSQPIRRCVRPTLARTAASAAVTAWSASRPNPSPSSRGCAITRGHPAGWLRLDDAGGRR